MKDDTLELVQRPYGDLVDDLLTAVVGGVVNEPIPFDVRSLAYPLSEPAAGVRGITGRHDGGAHSFIPDVDFSFTPATNAVVWLEEGTHPDDDTTFLVDYFRVESRSPLTDINVGGVTRTLIEAIGREIATVYGTINLAYLAGFVDTAEGPSLDHVVAILDVRRRTAEFAEGLVSFFRSAGVDGNITIPAGLGLTTTTGDASFETSEQRTLQAGQARIDVPARAIEGFAGDAGLVDAGAITEMIQPVAGIDRVTNFDPMIRAAADETDAQLRARARAALRALGKATVSAIANVIKAGGGEPVEFFDPNNALATRTTPGAVAVVVDAEPERLAGITAAVHTTRAAGVVATLIARYVFITPRVRLTIRPGISPAGQDQIADVVIGAVQAHVDGLTAGQPATGTDLLAALTADEDVVEAVIADVVVQRADLSAVGAGDAIDQLVDRLAGVDTSNPDHLAAAVAAALDEEPLPQPSDQRIPDRSLLLSTAEATAGEPASDADLEAGDFEVVAIVDGEDWWIALDMARSDIRVEEQDAQG